MGRYARCREQSWRPIGPQVSSGSTSLFFMWFRSARAHCVGAGFAGARPVCMGLLRVSEVQRADASDLGYDICDDGARSVIRCDTEAVI